MISSRIRGLGLLQAAMNIVWPAQCLHCGVPLQSADSLCVECWQQLTFAPLLDHNRCTKCGHPSPSFDVGGEGGALALSHPWHCKGHSKQSPISASRYVLAYDETSSHMILSFKNQGKLGFLPLFVRWLAAYSDGLFPQIDYITSPPPFFARLSRRGYCQASLLACGLSERIGANTGVDTRIFFKRQGVSVNTHKSQGRSLRFTRAQKSISIDRSCAHLLTNKNILIVDDVMTTGATIHQMARLLKQHRAKNVYALTLARRF